MNMIKKAKKILEQPVCMHCLGRQFAQLGTGYTNEERGKAVKQILDKNKDVFIVVKNLRKFRFPGISKNSSAGISSAKEKTTEDEKKNDAKTGYVVCSVCNDFFEQAHMQKWLNLIKKTAKGLDFKTFLVGTILSDELIEKEEWLWERVGIDYCEPLKSEINREMGKLVEKHLKKRFEPLNPDVCFILDIARNCVHVEIKSLMFYGEYQKLVRGIPQTRWPSGKYKTSVEQIIAKPFLTETKGSGTKFHGAGREDIDARCLGWRPFVLEILEPRKRLTLKDLKVLAKKIAKNKVRVRKIHLSDNREVARLKEIRYEKTYSAIVKCKKDVTKHDLKQLSKLVGVIEQRTPERVLHRRADLLRKRRILDIKTKWLNKKSFQLIVCTEAGTYVKEFISGDNGRTQPSISKALDNECMCKELDVIKIHI